MRKLSLEGAPARPRCINAPLYQLSGSDLRELLPASIDGTWALNLLGDHIEFLTRVVHYLRLTQPRDGLLIVLPKHSAGLVTICVTRVIGVRSAMVRYIQSDVYCSVHGTYLFQASQRHMEVRKDAGCTANPDVSRVIALSCNQFRYLRVEEAC